LITENRRGGGGEEDVIKTNYDAIQRHINFVRLLTEVLSSSFSSIDNFVL
jgi:hypothetical protein